MLYYFNLKQLLINYTQHDQNRTFKRFFSSKGAHFATRSCIFFIFAPLKYIFPPICDPPPKKKYFKKFKKTPGAGAATGLWLIDCSGLSYWLSHAWAIEALLVVWHLLRTIGLLFQYWANLCWQHWCCRRKRKQGCRKRSSRHFQNDRFRRWNRRDGSNLCSDFDSISCIDIIC